MKKLFAILAVMGSYFRISSACYGSDISSAQIDRLLKQQWLKKVVVFTKS